MYAAGKREIWITKSGYSIIRILSGRSNVFLLTNGRRNLLIDSSIPRLWNKIQKTLNGLNIRNIDYLILTHAHFDHVGNAHKIKEKYKALVIIHKKEAVYIISGENPRIEGSTFFTRFFVKYIAEPFLRFCRYEPCQYDFVVDTVFDLRYIGFDAYIMHTPGHTSGSVSVIVDNEVAIVGDTMFGIFKNSIFPPYAEDVRQMIQSWGRLLDTGCYAFIPSHGSVNTRQLVQKDYCRRIK